MDAWGQVLLFLVVALAVVGSVVFHFVRSHSLIEDWASRHGYRVVAAHYCWFWKGPFFWTTSKGQTVYRVTFEDDAGNRARAWVRCGGWFLGLLTNRVDVRWDE